MATRTSAKRGKVSKAVSNRSTKVSLPGQRQQPSRSSNTPGAPRGNRNALKHGAYLSDAKRTARARRDKYRRRGEREAREILAASGLGEDPLAKLVARQIARLEAMAHRLEGWHDVRGYFTAAGELKASVSKEIDVIGRLLDEARKLFDSRTPRGGAGGPTLAELLAGVEKRSQEKRKRPV